MQIRSTRRLGSPPAGAPEETRDGQTAPVLVLEPDHVAAGALERQLTAYGFHWIAIVQDLADARRIIEAAPITLAMLSLDRRAPAVLAMAQELVRSSIPLILTSATGRPLVFPGLPPDTPMVARGCPTEMLFAVFDTMRHRLRPTRP